MADGSFIVSVVCSCDLGLLVYSELYFGQYFPFSGCATCAALTYYCCGFSAHIWLHINLIKLVCLISLIWLFLFACLPIWMLYAAAAAFSLAKRHWDTHRVPKQMLWSCTKFFCLRAYAGSLYAWTKRKKQMLWSCTKLWHFDGNFSLTRKLLEQPCPKGSP